MIKSIRLLKKIGAKKVTVHSPKQNIANFELSKKYHTQWVGEVLSECERIGIQLMMENTSSWYLDENHNELFYSMLKKYPKMKLHIDVGHTNMCPHGNQVFNLIKRFKKRIVHYHFADNYGRRDNHLALGLGNAPWTKIVKAVKKSGYDDTITCEVFRSGSEGEIYSRDKLRKWWDRY